MVVEVDPAGEGDLGAGRHQQLGLGPTTGGEEIPAVDHGGGERSVVDHRPGAWPPGRAGMDLEAIGGLVAEEFQALRRSIKVRPSATRRSSSTERTSSRPAPSGYAAAPARCRRARARSGRWRGGTG
jgi:hypothetical protein